MKRFEHNYSQLKMFIMTYKEGSAGQLALNDVAGKAAIIIQDNKVTLVAGGFVYFTSFTTDDLLALANKAKEYKDFFETEQ